MRTNKFAGTCEACGTAVPAGAGLLLGRAGAWSTRCADCPPTAPPRGDHDGWHRGPIAALDFEATGTDALSVRIVSVGFVAGDGEAFTSLVNPGVPIPAESSAVHGIVDADVADAPGPAEVLTTLSALLGSAIAGGVPVAICHAPYDVTLLRAALRRHGLAAVDLDRLRVLDPLVLDWSIERGQFGPRKLTDLCRYYGVELTDAHTALADARATRALVAEMGARHAGLARPDLDAMMRAQRGWFADRAADWNRYAKRVGRSLDDPEGWPVRRG